MQIDPVYLTAWLSALLFFTSRMFSAGSSATKSTRAKSSVLRTLVSRPQQSGWRKRLNIAGLLTLAVHILLAFWLNHHFSHTAAEEHVANRTEAFLGVRSGLGIYANWLVLAVWSYQAFSTRRHVIAELFLWAMFVFASIVFAQPGSSAFFLVVASAALARSVYLHRLAKRKGVVS